MTTRRLTLRDRVGVALGMIALTAAGCTTPGAVAPATIPWSGTYVELGPMEESTSCGYTALVIPIKNPKPVADLVQDLIKSRGGDALIQVSSSSSSYFYLVGIKNCVTIKGKVVNFAK